MSAKSRWKLNPHLLLRRAGFPFSLIESLACPGAARWATQVAEARVEAEELRSALLKTLFPAEVRRLAALGDRSALRALSRQRKRVGRRSPGALPAGPWESVFVEAHARWVAAHQRMVEARVGLERTFGEEMLAVRGRLREIASRPQVREAIFLLVPGLLDTLGTRGAATAEERGRAADRALERRLYSFVQRLASKNETTSFFGPLTHAQVDDSLEQTSFGPESPTGVVKRETFAAFWAVATLAGAAAVDPALRKELPVRRIPASAVEGESAWGPDGKPFPLDAPARALYGRVDGTRAVPQLAAELGMAPEEAERSIRVLERVGFVRRDLEPLSTTPYPLEDLKSRLRDLPSAARWREEVQRFEQVLRRFEAAGLEERRKLLREAEAVFEKATGKPAHRGEGQMYADRTVLFEDCQGDMTPVRLAGAEARRIEAALSPALDLGAAYGRLRHQSLRDLATEVIEHLGGKARFLEFASELDGRIGKGALAREPEIERFLGGLVSRLKAASNGRVARVEPEALADLLRGDGGVRFASPDVMLEVRPEGPPRCVIGEVHPYVFAWGSQGHFAPDPEALQAAYRADLRPWGGAERMAVVLRRRRHKGLVSDAFPGSFIEVTGRAVNDPQRRIAIGDLRVELGGDGPVLMGPRGPVVLYVGEDDHPHLRAFAPPLVEMPPVRFGSHTPRIELGELVFQRERWELDPAEHEALSAARDPLELAVLMAEARRAAGWPRFVFASARSEPKPLCLDLEVPFAQMALQRLLREGPLRLVEMVPSPGGLWLRRGSGAHTSELRIAMVRQE